MISYDKLKQSVEALGFKFFNEGDYNLNLIFERTSDEFTNYMTDWFHVAFKVLGEKQVISIKCSTKPGLIGSVLNPITVDGITGTAVIASPQQIRKGYYFIDSALQEMLPFDKQDMFYRNKWNKCSYLKENACFDYWRDGNKDKVLDRTNFQHEKFFGTHCHKGGEPINNFSLGCIVFMAPDFNKMLYPIFRQAVKLWGNLFTPTFIESKHIL